MDKWLEMELARQLGPVAAPEGLWGRISVARKPVAAGWVLWPVLAMLVLFASGDLVWQITRSRSGVREMAQIGRQQLRIVTSATPACDFWSDDPAEIRNWVKAKGNMDVGLLPARSEEGSLVGVKLVEAHGERIAAIAYKTGGGEASLLVSASQAACLMCHVEAHRQM